MKLQLNHYSNSAAGWKFSEHSLSTFIFTLELIWVEAPENFVGNRVLRHTQNPFNCMKLPLNPGEIAPEVSESSIKERIVWHWVLNHGNLEVPTICSFGFHVLVKGLRYPKNHVLSTQSDLGARNEVINAAKMTDFWLFSSFFAHFHEI